MHVLVGAMVPDAGIVDGALLVLSDEGVLPKSGMLDGTLLVLGDARIQVCVHVEAGVVPVLGW